MVLKGYKNLELIIAPFVLMPMLFQIDMYGCSAQSIFYSDAMRYRDNHTTNHGKSKEDEKVLSYEACQ